MIALPPVKQAADYDCGPACARAIMQHYGLPTPPALSFASLARPDAGLSVYGIDALLASAGLLTLVGHFDLDTIRRLDGRPVVVHVAQYGGHWVVVAGTTYRRVYYLDVADGKTKALTFSDWNDQSYQTGVCAWPGRK